MILSRILAYTITNRGIVTNGRFWLGVSRLRVFVELGFDLEDFLDFFFLGH
jgi:hypothetical protein